MKDSFVSLGFAADKTEFGLVRDSLTETGMFNKKQVCFRSIHPFSPSYLRQGRMIMTTGPGHKLAMDPYLHRQIVRAPRAFCPIQMLGWNCCILNDILSPVKCPCRVLTEVGLDCPCICTECHMTFLLLASQ